MEIEQTPGPLQDLPSTCTLNIYRVRGGESNGQAESSINVLADGLVDVLAVEEPLEIRIEYGDDQNEVAKRIRKSISITMRTPGYDFELAVGFLFTEGIVRGAGDIEGVKFCGPSRNVVRLDLKPSVKVDLKRLERHFYTSSSCGVCGKSSIDALRIQSRYEVDAKTPRFSAQAIHELPSILRRSQGVFDSTGGLHASALFDSMGKLLIVREDVGRHNALDKVIGNAVMNGLLPLNDKLLLVSGRASFELVQKAAMAGIPFFAAVGAPSSLAVSLARESGMTLLGFVRDNRFNIYNGEARVVP
jgi:FdhD protein